MDENRQRPVVAEVVDPTRDTPYHTPPAGPPPVPSGATGPAAGTAAEGSFLPPMPPPPAMFAERRPQSPITWREALAILLTVVLCDLTIYRGAGFGGLALLFAVAPALLLLGSHRPRVGWRFGLVGLMTLALAVKMVWCGSGLLVVIGFTLTVAFAMTLSGLCPYVLEIVVFALRTTLSGSEGLAHYCRSVNKITDRMPGSGLAAIALPAAALVVFGSIFTLANPDLLSWLGDRVEEFMRTLRLLIGDRVLDGWECLFWAAVVWVTLGLLRPVMRLSSNVVPEESAQPPGEPRMSPLYAAFRNTLVALIALFAVYLVFEFVNLGRDDFPEIPGLSAYAHEGAAWLTLALVLATVVLSLIFQGQFLHDARLKRVRLLAWLWSAENIILAFAVYCRMYIYVDYNGMTWMRIVGLFGMTAVVVGFLLVLWKIAYNRDFLWLMRRHLWTLAITIYLFALTPVDAIWVEYNVRQILSGDLHPSVQLSVHEIGSEGVLLLQPLLDCEDEKIREGIRAMLAKRHEQREATARSNQRHGWTTYQLADQLVLDGLRASQADWVPYGDRAARDAALETFDQYVWQWY